MSDRSPARIWGLMILLSLAGWIALIVWLVL